MLAALAGCATGESSTPVPTQPLIAMTLTDTPSPQPPTATRSTLPGPADLATATPETAPDETPALDPVADELVRLAQRRLAETLDLSTRRIQVIEVRALRWPDSSLGCPLPDQSYTPIEIDGYRIVLSVGEREYIFHSDFDRVLPCDPQNERLPED